MLDAARAKGVYRRLTLGDLTTPLPAEPGEYPLIAATNAATRNATGAKMPALPATLPINT